MSEIAAGILATPANKLATDTSGRVTVGTNADKTGYTLTAGEHTSIQSDVQSGMTAQGYTSARALKLDNLDATVSSRSTLTAAGVWSHTTRTLTSFGTLVDDIANAVWSATTRTLTGFGTLVSDIWSYASRTLTDFSDTFADVIWNRLRSAVSRPAGSFGDYLDMKISQVSGGSGGTDWTVDERKQIRYVLGIDGEQMAPAGSTGYIPSIKAKTDQLTFTTEGGDSVVLALTKRVAAAGIDSSSFAAGAVSSAAIADGAITAAKIALDAIGSSQLAASAVNEIAAAILATPANKLATDTSGRVTVGVNADKTGYTLTTGEHSAIQSDVQSALSAQGYTSVRAGRLDNLDATVSSRAAPGAAMTLQNGAITSATLSSTALDAISQRILTTALDSVEASATAKSLAWALAKLLNRVELDTGTGKLVVYQTDNATRYFEQTLSPASSLPLFKGLGEAQ